MHQPVNNRIQVGGLICDDISADRIWVYFALFPNTIGHDNVVPYKSIFSREFLMDPEKLLTFVQHADKTAEAWVFGFEQGMEFAQGCVLRADCCAMRQINRIIRIGKYFSFLCPAQNSVNDIFAKIKLVL